MRRTILAASLAASMAMGAARADEIKDLDQKVASLDQRVSALDGTLRPPPPPSAELAERRLVDAQVLYELKSYEAASFILFEVVEKFPRSSAYPEALYYLADSLFLQRDYLSARRFFEKVVAEGQQNRHYQDALLRLVELSLHTGEYGPVDGYIAKLHQVGGAARLPAVPYVEGKYYFFRQQYDRALASLQKVGAGNPYYLRARYFVGAANVGRGHLSEAARAFRQIVAQPAKTTDQKQIVALSHMALGRIAYQNNKLDQALDEYSKIPARSPLFNDALYESAWVDIKAKAYQRAARMLDLLQLNAPDSPRLPEVKLLIGQLHIREDRFGPANDIFTATHDEYEPVHRQLAAALAKSADTPAYFRGLIAQHMEDFETAAALPASASRWVKAEPQMAELTTLLKDESALRRSLEDSERLIARLDQAMTGPSRVNIVPELATARARAIAASNECSLIKGSLTDMMTKLLAPVTGQDPEFVQLRTERDRLAKEMRKLPASTADLATRQAQAHAAYEALDKRVVELQANLHGVQAAAAATRKFYEERLKGQLPADRREKATRELEQFVSKVAQESGNADQIRREIEDARHTAMVDDSDLQAALQLRQQYDQVLRRLGELEGRARERLTASDRSQAMRIESTLVHAQAVEQKVGLLNQRIDQLLDTRLAALKDEVSEEKVKLAAYRQKLSGYHGESADVGGAIVADSFKAATARLNDVVVRADVGIIDVAWALKEASTQHATKLMAERKRELKELDDQYPDLVDAKVQP